MREGIGCNRLPYFTEEEKQLLRGSADYFALNHYTSRYGREPDTFECLINENGANVCGGDGWDQDQCCEALTFGMDGNSIGPHANGSDWFYSVPWGMRKLLNWVYDRYKTPIVITENGSVDP